MVENYLSNAKWYYLLDDVNKIKEKKALNILKTLRLDLTTLCNLNCKYCLYRSESSIINNIKTKVKQKIIPSYYGVVIPHPKIPGVPEIHDTYKIDRYGNLDKGHTTINLPNGEKIRINHNE